jgi:hypothetical protein
MQVLVNMAVDGYIRTTLLAIFITSDEVVGCSALYMVTNHPSSPVELIDVEGSDDSLVQLVQVHVILRTSRYASSARGQLAPARRAAECSLLGFQLALLPGLLQHRVVDLARKLLPQQSSSLLHFPVK